MKIEKTYLRKKPVKADPKLEPRIRIKKQTKNGIVSSCYLHFVYNPATKKRVNRSITFGDKLPKKEAYRQIMKWRRDMLKEIDNAR